MKTVLDADLALALLDQYIASHTLLIEDLAAAADADTGEIARLKQERDDARNVLATLDPSDANAIRDILARFAAPWMLIRRRAWHASCRLVCGYSCWLACGPEPIA